MSSLSSLFGGSAAVTGRPGSSRDLRRIQDLINQATTGRAQEVAGIERLFSQFGETARGDLAEREQQTRARQTQQLAGSNLLNTTLRASREPGLSARFGRERRGIDEDVARLQAGFRERQLIRPESIAEAARAATSVDTRPVQAFIPPTSAQVNAPNRSFIRPGGGGGGGGAPSSTSPFIRGGSTGSAQSARVLPNPKATGGFAGIAGGGTPPARVIGGQAIAGLGAPSRPATSGGGTGSISPSFQSGSVPQEVAQQEDPFGVGGQQEASAPPEPRRMTAAQFLKEFPRGIPKGSNIRVMII